MSSKLNKSQKQLVFMATKLHLLNFHKPGLETHYIKLSKCKLKILNCELKNTSTRKILHAHFFIVTFPAKNFFEIHNCKLNILQCLQGICSIFIRNKEVIFNI